MTAFELNFLNPEDRFLDSDTQNPVTEEHMKNIAKETPVSGAANVLCIKTRAMLFAEKDGTIFCDNPNPCKDCIQKKHADGTKVIH